ncbi:efflux RND transporter periplasmic adaptor subunit [Chondrinema litorale]|uniref:efflux RND transporter periplasmic adaptor subunit n=1 Tax=Chondrinema litorale TaxID=2994555 RepID=UPI0025436F06|nr:efflux RND transporter periplasmic adaptor subunit [Chondrinema litorale]UZR98866.1 efflux RND transporter periplasmic adaptor subunit [Chondrinema litorale]
MKKSLIYIIAILVAGVAVYFFFIKKENTEITVKTVKVTKETINQVITATGTIEPITQVEVGTQVSGVIEKIYVDYNSDVKAGQLLAELDKTTLLATLNEAKASLKNAEIERDYLQKSFDRLKKLYDNKRISDTDFDEAEYNLKNAIGVVEQRQSDVDRAKTNLGYANIYSPIDGVVLSRAVDEGQTVASSYSTPELFTIARDLKQMQVEADIDEADIGEVELGQRVMFTVDAYPGEEFAGEVTQIRLEPEEESNVVTYTVIIKADNPDLKLMPGLTASITVYTLEMPNILTIEAKALRFQPDQQVMAQYKEQVNDGDGPKMAEGNAPPEGGKMVPVNMPAQNEQDDSKGMVWVKQGTNIHPQPVKTGESDGVLVQVIEGLKEGDEVVYSMEAMKEAAGDAGGGGESSPFMPKPPGSDKKK